MKRLFLIGVITIPLLASEHNPVSANWAVVISNHLTPDHSLERSDSVSTIRPENISIPAPRVLHRSIAIDPLRITRHDISNPHMDQAAIQMITSDLDAQQLTEMAVTTFLGAENSPLQSQLMGRVKPKLRDIVNSVMDEHREAIAALRKLKQDQAAGTGSSSSDSSQQSLHTSISRLIAQSIEEMMYDKETETESQRKLSESRQKKMRIALIANIFTASAAAIITFLGKQSQC